MATKASTNKDFYKSSAFYIGASAIASLANYALYPILAKLISPSQLGDVGIILAIIVQVGSLLLAFNIVSIYLVSRESESSAIAKLETIQRGLVRLSLICSVGIVVLLPVLKNLFQIDGYAPLIGLAVLLVVIMPSIIWTGYLQGHKALPLIGVYNLINAFAKVICASLLAWAGLGAGGAIFGIALGFVISLIALRLLSPYRLPSIISTIRKQSGVLSLTSIRLYIIETLAVSAVVASFYSLDIVTAKIFFDRDAAGVYVGASTIAGTVYYIIMTLAWVVLPHFSPKDMKHNLGLLIKAVLLAVGVAAGFGGLFYVFGEQVIRLVLGDAYLPIQSILWKVCISQAVIATTTMVAFSLLVLRKRGALTISLLMVGSTALAVLLSNKDSAGLAHALLLGETAGLVLSVLSIKLRSLILKDI